MLDLDGMFPSCYMCGEALIVRRRRAGVEPEVDSSSFLERQQISDARRLSVVRPSVPSCFLPLFISTTPIHQLQSQLKTDLKSRFRAKSEKLRKSCLRWAPNLHVLGRRGSAGTAASPPGWLGRAEGSEGGYAGFIG